MFGPSKIMKWCDQNLQGVRRSRRKTLAHIVAGAMKMKGVGVLALGRAMDGPVIAKHRIKRVDRFLANEELELFEIANLLFNVLRGQEKHPVVLADWTDRHAYEQLVFSITKDGRSMPFYAITIESTHFASQTEGTKIEAERQALEHVHAMCPAGIQPIIVADRGFGNEGGLGKSQSGDGPSCNVCPSNTTWKRRRTSVCCPNWGYAKDTCPKTGAGV